MTIKTEKQKQHVALQILPKGWKAEMSLPPNLAHSICHSHCLNPRLSDAIAPDKDYTLFIMKEVCAYVCVCACV